MMLMAAIRSYEIGRHNGPYGTRFDQSGYV